MTNRTIIRIVILGTISVIGIIALQTYWVLTSLDAEEREFNQKVHIALRKVAEDLSEMTQIELPTTGLIQQHSSDIFIVNVNSVIDANNLEYFLKRELEAVALNETFEYGIYDCASDEMLYGNYIASETDTKKLEERTDLPMYDELIYYFDVHFPTRTSYLVSNMWIPILFSIIMLIAVTFFISSMMVILKQKRLSEMQKDFINNMTHEFKTPLSTIKLTNNAFLKDSSIRKNEKLYNYAKIIRDQNERLNDQVEKVLQLARIEKGNFTITKKDVNLNETIAEVCRNVEPRITEREGLLDLSLGDKQYNIEADPLHLTNVLYNLLDNAIKYCKGNPKVSVILERLNKGVRLRIQDNGTGIAPDDMKRVFEKFYRVPTGNLHDVKGFGLGLFYVKSICEGHNWKLNLESEIGRGTAVNISIPT